MYNSLASFLVALAVSVGLTPLVRALARRSGMIAKPRADRWHQKPTALLGGVAIYVAFLASFLAYRDKSMAGEALLVLSASAMFLLGLVDDLKRLKPYAKLIGQLVAATALTSFGLQLPWTGSVVVNQALTIFWLVGVTNAMNLLDNIDGLATGVAVIAGGFMTYFFWLSGQPSQASLAAAFSGACLGFLLYNFNPATIFMGDGGSLFIGFFLGALPLLHSKQPHSGSLIAVLAPPVLVLAIPILDTTLVTLSRKLAGRPVSQGGRDHVSHRLVALGLSERGATLTLYGMALVSGLTAVAAYRFQASIALGLLPIFALGFFFIAIYLARVKVYRAVENEGEVRGRALLPTLADFTYKRRIFEVLNDFVLVLLSYYCAFLLRFEGQLLQPHWEKFQASLPLVIVVQLAVFLATGLYRGLWRYTSIDDLRRFLRSTLLASVASIAAIYVVFGGWYGFSRAALVLDGILLFLGVAATRISFRLIRSWLGQRIYGHKGKRILIYGADDGGELLVRQLQNNQELGMVAIGFVDDDPRKVGKLIHGIRVVGTSDLLPELLPQLHVEELLVSSESFDEGRIARLVVLCREQAVGFRRARFALE